MGSPGKRIKAEGPVPPGPDDLLTITDEGLQNMTMAKLKELVPTLVLDIDPEDITDREDLITFLRLNSL